MGKYPRIVIIKLAAIGDVALACQALSEFRQSVDSKLEIHWFIDHALGGLAKALTSNTIEDSNLSFHLLDSERLFLGSLIEKIGIALKIFREVLRLAPDAIVILHRDRRYHLLLRPALPRGILIRLSQDSKTKGHELDIYQDAFIELKNHLKLTELAIPKPKECTTQISKVSQKRIGILVGGGRNQKTDFPEKRWPHLRQLLEMILLKTQAHVVLFGGKDDMNEAVRIQANIVDLTRISDLVGKTALEDTPAELKKLDVFITIDSGLAHIAASVMTSPHQKIISLFGPTNPATWTPRAQGLGQVVVMRSTQDCSPCYHDDGNFKPCRFSGTDFQKCMKAIQVDSVFNLLTKSLMPNATPIDLVTPDLFG